MKINKVKAKQIVSILLLLTSIFIVFSVEAGSSLWGKRESDYVSQSLNEAPKTPSLSETKVIEQQFVAQYSRLDQISLRFEYQFGAEKLPDWIKLCILDQAGNIHFETTLTPDQLNNWVFTEIPVNAYLISGQKYRVQVSADTAKDELHLFGRSEENQTQLLSVAGQEQSFGLDMKLEFSAFRSTLFAVWLAGALIAGLFCWKPALQEGKFEKVIAIGQCAIVLALMNLTIEFASKTLDQYFSISAALAGLFWCSFITLFFFVLTNRLRVSIILTGCLLFAFGLANNLTLSYRGRPIVFSDIRSAGTALSVIGVYHIALEKAVWFSLACLIVIIAMALVMRERRIRERKKRLILDTAIVVLFGGIAFNLQQITVIQQYHFTPNPWKTADSANKNGFLVNFAASMTTERVSKPEGYSDKKINELAAQYKSDRARTAERPDIIVIMNESWTDLSNTSALKTDVDPMPFLHTLMESDSVASGQTIVPVFGGGTVKSEFEFLIAASSQIYINGSPYTAYLPENTPSLASDLGQLGYKTVAMHPNAAENWSRNVGYPKLGFDEFYDIDSFENLESIRYWPSDASTYQNIIRVDEKTDQPLFLFCVTMQNHGGYGDENFASTVHVTDPQVDCPQAEQYLSLLQDTDRAFAELTDYYSKKEKPTLILMFGDHLPKVEEEFYDALFASDDWVGKHTTPYLIWSNYGAVDASDAVPKIGSAYLSSLLMQIADLPLTGFQKYMLELQTSYPLLLPTETNGGIAEGDVPLDVWTEYAMLQYALFSRDLGGASTCFEYFD